MSRLRQNLAILARHQRGDLVGPAFKDIGEFEKRCRALPRIAGPVGALEGLAGRHHRIYGKTGRSVGGCSDN